ncbi:Pimeloyl-ACP methyl ester carboxylesterase [Salinihabitans flavidus]|uniref:Pimeloyl-ACP methyl ester carboxylesterase n=1 Tax=Salinihabitans flavidus TaxID=569882 RepID=A0A1H8Q795_9RHOB|nr:alpha/beta fold hydrolase [Salinihabitans flavidus]SEO49898.1 Pimeloyl-ACP methyl ester carboxylesterase [Salinihabitans flavidus]
MLNLIDYGGDGAHPPLLIVHGLYGSARNWGAVAKRMADGRRVVAVDMRNHGESPWKDTQSYEDMAADLDEVLDRLGGKWDVLGHSMGGKAAMVLALTRPARVNRLIVADIAPVAYGHTQGHFIDAMQSVDLSAVEKRSDAMDQLAPHVDDPTLRSFFTQSLDLKQKKWRLNLDVLKAEMPKILGFPEIKGQYDGPVLFLTGAESDYVTPDHRPAIKALFPRARFLRINGAGHWLHAEKPREFIATLRAWLER